METIPTSDQRLRLAHSRMMIANTIAMIRPTLSFNSRFTSTLRPSATANVTVCSSDSRM